MSKLVMFLGGFAVGAILGFLGAEVWTYVAVGGIPLIGGLIQAAMRRKINKVIDISPNGSKPTEPKIRFPKDIHNKHNLNK